MMVYSLEQFCADSSQALKSGKPQAEALGEIAQRLSDLILEPSFIAKTFNDDTPPGKEVLFHDPDLDFYVLAHVQKGGKVGKPHTHGTSWAIYGNAKAKTTMTEYRRLNPDEEAAILEVSEVYDLTPGQTRAYGPGKIHSTAHPDLAWVVRVTGTDLDVLPRYHFRKSTDRVVGAA